MSKAECSMTSRSLEMELKTSDPLHNASTPTSNLQSCCAKQGSRLSPPTLRWPKILSRLALTDCYRWLRKGKSGGEPSFPTLRLHCRRAHQARKAFNQNVSRWCVCSYGGEGGLAPALSCPQ